MFILSLNAALVIAHFTKDEKHNQQAKQKGGQIPRMGGGQVPRFRCLNLK
jgi:hypothetical protein